MHFPYAPFALPQQPSPGSTPPVPSPTPSPPPEASRHPVQAPLPLDILRNTQISVFFPLKDERVPSSLANFIVRDEGQCSPRFVRSTLYAIPHRADLLSQTGLPMAVIVHPLADTVSGEVCTSSRGGHAQLHHPARAADCGLRRVPATSVCAVPRLRQQVQPLGFGWSAICLLFLQYAERWSVHLVPTPAHPVALSSVSPSYFVPLGVDGTRTDASRRPELCRGSVDFAAPANYYNYPPRVRAGENHTRARGAKSDRK